ncbi:MAG: hypothetical protein JXQ73_10445, partial [Phycisphaerae bacterium]|nr:hypothetical protein [Phycisphaerae bacterium]
MIETLAADVAIKASLVYLLALLADRLLRKRWILARSAMWNACLLALLLLPLATATFPRLRIRCLPPDQAPAA